MAEGRSKHPNNAEREVPQPSGTGTTPATAGAGNTRVRSNTPENLKGEINPSAPTAGTEGPSTNIANPERFEREERKARNDGEIDGVNVSIPQPDGNSTGENPTEQRPGKEGGGNLRKAG